MFDKQTLTFPAEGGIELTAWLFLPTQRTQPLPAITMAHGYAATRYHGIERLAEALATAGFAVLLHDHRGFGDSGGEPRQDVNPWQQIADWRSAISYLQERPEVDEKRIGLWGPSYAGGHAIVLGATDRRLKAVVSWVPTIDGHATGQRRVPPERIDALEAAFAADDRAQLKGQPLAMQLIVSDDMSVNASYRDPISIQFFLQPIPEGKWKNKVTLRSTRWARMYEPGRWVDRVSPTPLLLVVATHDHSTGTDLALKAYEKALQPKKLVLIQGGHYSAYLEQFDVAAKATVDWFIEHL
jgi:dienelactone hydrolase